MSPLRAGGSLLLALACQTALGALWPGIHDWLDLLYLPVIWYAMVHSQRSAMVLGMLAGLLQDAWFHVGLFGLNGFKKTLIGWSLGGIGARIDLNSQAGRMGAGVLISLADTGLDAALRSLVDQQASVPGPLSIIGRALIGGILVSVVFSAAERTASRKLLSRWS